MPNAGRLSDFLLYKKCRKRTFAMAEFPIKKAVAPAAHSATLQQLSSASASMLTSYPWPGNVRQLRNFCERLVIVADDYQL